MRTVDLSQTSLRELNAALHGLGSFTNETHWRVLNPRGQHARYPIGGDTHTDAAAREAPKGAGLGVTIGAVGEGMVAGW